MSIKKDITSLIQREWYNYVREPSFEDHDEMIVKKEIPFGNANVDLCQYCNIIPYDRTLVNVDNGEYLNASHVTLFEGNEQLKFIISQAPLLRGENDTRPRFWRSILQNEVKVIVSLIGSAKCNYYPTNLKKNKLEWVGEESVSVELMKSPQSILPGVTLRNFKITSNLLSNFVSHFSYENWPNYGVPGGTKEIRDLVHTILCEPDITQLNKTSLLIHCSGGVGRSGTFATILTGMKLGKRRVETLPFPFEEEKLIPFSVVPIVKQLRHCRHPWCVETLPQYQFIYKTLTEAWQL